MKIRLVALSSDKVFVQTFNGIEWEQEKMSYEAFEEMFMDNFPKYYHEFINTITHKNCAEYFYHYGETPEMVRKGETFEFIS